MGIVVGLIGIAATGVLGFVFWRLTARQTVELRNFLVDAIAASTESPDTTKRLIADRFKRGELRGKVFKWPDGKYSISWDETLADGIKSDDKVSLSKQ